MDRLHSITPKRRFIAAFSSAAIIVLVGAAVAVGLANVLQRQAEVRRSEAVIRANDDLLQRLTDAETGQRGYIIAGDSSYLDPYRGARADVERASSTLRELVADDSATARLQMALDTVITSRLRVLDGRVSMRRSAGFDSTRRALIAGGGKELMDSTRRLSDAIEQRYVAREASQLAAQSREARILFAVLVIGTGLAALVALSLNGMLGRVAVDQQRLVTRLTEQNEELRAQADELQRQQAQLEEQSTELEVANQDLEERTTEAERLRAEAEQANESKSAFLAMMSHDLRTPLNAIAGYADLMDAGIGGELNDTQKDYVRRIRASNRFLMSLIEDVLAFAKTEAGETSMRCEPLRLREFLATIEPMVAPQLKAGRLRFLVSHSCGVDDCGTRAVADAERLRQLVLNLVTNAIKFTPAGGEIELFCGCDPKNVWLTVRDTGVGIPADKLQEVFKPFVQLDAARATSRGGVGLGLAISRELARRMGGTLTVASTVGEGSAFTLTLPREKHDGDSPSNDSNPVARLRRSARITAT